MPGWEVSAFSSSDFRRLLRFSAQATPAHIESKQHTTYFSNYLETLGAATIVGERDYVDRDFLEDFAAYYVRCHEDYSRLCGRLHFFSAPFSASDFDAFLTGKDSPLNTAILQASYLGFIVVKPLPETIFGRTCLATYPSENRRHFPITRPYEVSLFGTKLTVRSLAFQEQDQAAAACATSALWSAFQGTGVLFQHHIPSPVEITRSAADRMPIGGRALPSSGLTSLQMAHAIRQVTLEPTMLGSVSDAEQWKANAYAYIRGRIPVIVTGPLMDHADPKAPHQLGRHAVVLAGYSLGGNPSASSGITFTASRIDKFYAHDDQIGAFARMECPGAANPFSLETSWTGSTDQMTVRLKPDTLLLPLYHKIRVPFSHVRSELLQFEATIQSLRSIGLATFLPNFEWDVYLTYVNALKEEIGSTAPAGELRRNLLELRMPRFIWRASALVSGVRHLDLLFDATGLEHGNCCFRVVEWISDVGDLIRIVDNSGARSALELEPSWRVVSRIVSADAT
jgi:hypothetical protein